MGQHEKAPPAFKAAVLVISDSSHRGERRDRSGLLLRDRLEAEGAASVAYEIVSDDRAGIEAQLLVWADQEALDLVLTTGGTGLGPRDNTPEAMNAVVDREVPGIAEALRAWGLNYTPFAMLSRARAGLRGKTLIINLPGSVKAVEESMEALFPGILHAFSMIRGGGHES